PGPAEGDADGPSKTCLAGLRERGVSFMEWPTKGVRTPLRLVGSALGPLRLVMRDRKPGGVMPVMDCELARALLDAAPIFQLAGVRDLLFSGIYQYRTRHGSSKLSEHAHGLAIDVHQFGMVDGRVIDVQRDFEPGVGEWPKDRVLDMVTCVGTPENPAGRTLRELACSLRLSSAFREIITADDNSDHDNHFHIEAFPDPLTRTRALLSRRDPAIDD
ncbi:MAG: Extensin-like protein, partial [Myxococcales bacterium]|nr:Extensin-like protein [Myxococcales bacterium]